jgi:methionine aminopeptidase
MDENTAFFSISFNAIFIPPPAQEFCGHGVGSVFHTNPSILHYRNNEPQGIMAVGHTFTIEPMICEGSNKVIMR